MPRPTRRPRAVRSAFTLTEMLMVIALIGVLAALLIPVTAKAREQARRVQCASNIRQICLAAIRHAQDDERGIYIPNPEGDNNVDDFNPLYPKYVKDLRIFVCPSTTNIVDGRSDLTNNAVGGANGLHGHSYEIRNWAEAGVRFPDGMVFAVKTAKNYRQFRHSSTGALIMDADDSTENGDQNNWPNASDNHGAAGFNCGYMDGHVEFVPPGRRLLEAFLEGYYDPGLPDSIYSQYGVSHSGNTFKYVR
jgi:prepilin-type N-terminal cleavage/methylation domain-containing protein/prepilin-type processing-associated H-X9-DG protein